jgi:hypothetical protein
MKCVQVSLIVPIDDPNIALLIHRATDCLEDMSQSAIVHDGIFGLGDEKQNIQSEKAFEEAAAKGFRPCAFLRPCLPPTCIPTNECEQATDVVILRSGM